MYILKLRKQLYCARTVGCQLAAFSGAFFILKSVTPSIITKKNLLLFLSRMFTITLIHLSVIFQSYTLLFYILYFLMRYLRLVYAPGSKTSHALGAS